MTLEQLANEIAANAAQLETLEAERATHEGEAIEAMLKASAKGLKYEKVLESWKNSTRDFPGEDSYYSDRRRGVKLYRFESNSFYPNNLHCSITIDEKDVWLMSDGSLHLYHHTATVSRYEGTVDDHDYAFVRTMEPSELDAERVGKALAELLAKRLRDLGERTKAQSERIEKIKAMLNA